MKIIKNQTLYQCSYCNKRLLTKTGCILHENEYCKGDNSPHAEHLKDMVKNCDHEFATHWRYIPGETVKEPDYDYCIKCGYIAE